MSHPLVDAPRDVPPISRREPAEGSWLRAGFALYGLPAASVPDARSRRAFEDEDHQISRSLKSFPDE
jgi:hypothetical protein